MRITLNLLGILSVMFVSPWLFLIVLIVFSLRYTAIEIALLGFAFDSVWHSGLWYNLPLFTLISLMLLWGCAPIRRSLLV